MLRGIAKRSSQVIKIVEHLLCSGQGFLASPETNLCYQLFSVCHAPYLRAVNPEDIAGRFRRRCIPRCQWASFVHSDPQQEGRELLRKRCSELEPLSGSWMIDREPGRVQEVAAERL